MKNISYCWILLEREGGGCQQMSYKDPVVCARPHRKDIRSEHSSIAQKKARVIQMRLKNIHIQTDKLLTKAIQ